MFCKNCGAKLEDGDRFCANCGYKVNVKTVAPTVRQSNGNTFPNNLLRTRMSDKTTILVLLVSIATIVTVLVCDVFTINCESKQSYFYNGSWYDYNEGEMHSDVSVFGEVDLDHTNSKEAEKVIGSYLKIVLVVVIIVVALHLLLYFNSHYVAAMISAFGGVGAYLLLYAALSSAWAEYKGEYCTHTVSWEFGSVVVIIGCILSGIILAVKCVKTSET